MDIHFNCTLCGRCCQDLRLPLTVAEARAWLRRGHALEVLTEAVPWAVDPPATEMADYKRDRSFRVLAGELAARVSVLLVARFDGPCPNLRPDLRCGIYEERPLVCRVYPAEIHPFLSFDAARKACPPDAWADNHPRLLHEGRPVAENLGARIATARSDAISDVPLKAALCRRLGIQATALAHEGYLAFQVAGGDLLAAIEDATGLPLPRDPPPLPGWTLVSNRRTTTQALLSVAAATALVPAGAAGPVSYLAFLPDEP